MNTCVVSLVQAGAGAQLSWLLGLLKLKAASAFLPLPVFSRPVRAADGAGALATEASLLPGLPLLLQVGALGGKLSCEAIIFTRRSSRSCSVRAATWTGPLLPSRVASMSSDDVDGCRWCCVASDTAPRSGSSSCHRRLQAAICRPSGTRVQWALSTPRIDGPARSAGVSSSPSLESSDDSSLLSSPLVDEDDDDDESSLWNSVAWLACPPCANSSRVASASGSTSTSRSVP